MGAGASDDVGEAMLDGGGHGLRAGRHVEFGEDAFYVEADGPFGDPHNLGDLPVGLAVFHPIQNRQLPQGQLFHTVVH